MAKSFQMAWLHSHRESLNTMFLFDDSRNRTQIPFSMRFILIEWSEQQNKNYSQNYNYDLPRLRCGSIQAEYCNAHAHLVIHSFRIHLKQSVPLCMLLNRICFSIECHNTISILMPLGIVTFYHELAERISINFEFGMRPNSKQHQVNTNDASIWNIRLAGMI